MNDWTGNDTCGGGSNGGGHGSRGASVASVFGTDWHDGYHGRGGGYDVGACQSARVERNHTGLFRGGVNGGGVRGCSAAYRDMAERDRVRAGRAERPSVGVMRFLPWLGARLGGCETTEGAGVMAKRAPYIRFWVLAAMIFLGLHWVMSGWMDSIEARIWLYEHLTEWRR